MHQGFPCSPTLVPFPNLLCGWGDPRTDFFWGGTHRGRICHCPRRNPWADGTSDLALFWTHPNDLTRDPFGGGICCHQKTVSVSLIMHSESTPLWGLVYQNPQSLHLCWHWKGFRVSVYVCKRKRGDIYIAPMWFPQFRKMGLFWKGKRPLSQVMLQHLLKTTEAQALSP